MTELKTTEQSADYSGAFRGSLQGEGRSGVHHMEAKMSVKNEENVFACVLSASGMAGRDLSDKLTPSFILLAFW